MILAAPPADLNEALVLALARAKALGRTAYLVAADADIHPSELSKVVNGRRQPSVAQAQRIAAALGEPVESLFPSLRERAPDDGPERVRKTTSGHDTVDRHTE